ncbi:MAG: hypothetical protein GXO87_02465 [Chlorobi bacterium]|nr:hypothetical protein [Chlorobiota bacterium]
MKNKIKYILLSLSILQLSVFAQGIDNLQFLLTLTDSSVNSIAKDLSAEKNYFLNIIAPEEYKLLAERARFAFAQTELNIADDSTSSNVISYFVENARIEYPDVFRDGWFGEYLVERKAELSGSFLIETRKGKSIAKEFNITETDSVEYDKIKQIELASLPFTKGSIPAEPFFSSLWEPIIAVGTVVITVVLLFTTRTK